MNAHDNDIRDLLGAWAVDALDDVERARVERALRVDAELRDEARELRETVALLAEADAQAPPPELREAVLEQVARRPQGARDEPQPETEVKAASRRREVVRRRRSPWQWIGAAAAVVAIAVLGVVAIQQSDRAERAEQQVAAVQTALQQPGAELVTADTADGGRVAAILGADEAVFSAGNMPALADQDYQLWVMDGDVITSAGILTWRDGHLLASVEDFPTDAALAISVEPVGGSPQPTTEPLAVLTL